MAATITYMTEWGWAVHDLFHWTRPETPFMLANEVHFQEPWWTLEHKFIREAQQQRTNRFAQRRHHQHLLTGIDWHTYRQLRPSNEGTSKHGSRELCTAKRSTPPRPVHCVMSRQRPNMSYGSANGTGTSSTHPYHQNGWSASRALMKNLCGRKAGFHSNPKTTCATTTHTMDMAFGRTFNPSDPTSMQA